MPDHALPRGVAIVTCEYDPFPGGIGTYSTRMADALKSAGVDVRVIAPAYPDLSVEESPSVHRLLRHHKLDGPAAVKIARLLRALPDDFVVLAADIRTILLVYATRWFHKKPYLAMVHGSEAAKFRPGTIAFKLARRAYMSATRVAYNSEATGNIFREAFGAPDNEVVTYLGVDPRWFDTAEGEFESSVLRALPQSAKVVCSVGRIEPRKGQLQAVRAIAELQAQYPETEMVYVVVGRPEDHEYTEEVGRQAEALGVSIIFTGRLSEDDIKRLYQRSSCHLLLAQPLPGKVEGFGLVLLEAGAQGCPSIAAREGGIPEVLGESDTLVASGDLVGIARTIHRLAGDENQQAAASAAILQRAREFSWSNCMKRTFATEEGAAK